MATLFETQSIPELVPMFRFQWEQAQDCHVILYPEGMVKLSTSAGEIMKKCDGEKTVANIIAELNTQFPDVDLDDDVYKFLEEAHENGWIRAK